MKVFSILLMFTITIVSGKKGQSASNCIPSVTTVSGSATTTGKICSGDLIFSENFDKLDLSVWQHENTLAGGGNWEFQWYTNNRSNSYAENGIFYIRPTLTSGDFGENYLTSGILNLHGGAPADQCTNPLFYGCERTGNQENILNPIKSARVRTVNSFAFKFGKVEVKTKMPAGDWLWPAIWFMPKHNFYGSWPSSGEIDLVESRGNRNLTLNGVNIGVQEISSTLHFGPYSGKNAYETSSFRKQSTENGFNLDFHKYQMEWTPEHIKFLIDDVETGTIPVGEGFWSRGGFDTSDLDNPWKYNTKMAPFDQEFYIILNLAVGGIAYFPDSAENQDGKPWSNISPTAAKDFWNGRDTWLPTWNLNENYSKDASLQVDYVHIWAL